MSESSSACYTVTGLVSPVIWWAVCYSLTAHALMHSFDRRDWRTSHGRLVVISLSAVMRLRRDASPHCSSDGAATQGQTQTLVIMEGRSWLMKDRVWEMGSRVRPVGSTTGARWCKELRNIMEVHSVLLLHDPQTCIYREQLMQELKVGVQILLAN